MAITGHRALITVDAAEWQLYVTADTYCGWNGHVPVPNIYGACKCMALSLVKINIFNAIVVQLYVFLIFFSPDSVVVQLSAQPLQPNIKGR